MNDTVLTAAAAAVLLAVFGGLTWWLTETDEHRRDRLAARAERKARRRTR